MCSRPKLTKAQLVSEIVERYLNRSIEDLKNEQAENLSQKEQGEESQAQRPGDL